MPNPFEPTEIEAVAIMNVGLMTVHLFIIVILMLLLIYSFRTLKDYLMIIIVYSFSLYFGMNGMTHPHIPFSPMFEIFFLVFQTGIFILASLEMYEKKR